MTLYVVKTNIILKLLKYINETFVMTANYHPKEQPLSQQINNPVFLDRLVEIEYTSNHVISNSKLANDFMSTINDSIIIEII